MKTNPAKIGFALIKLSTEQFAMLDSEVEDVSSDDTVSLETQIKFGIEPNEKLFTVFPLFKYKKKDIPFLIIETGCHFSILDEFWESLIEGNEMTFPKNLVTHFSVIAVGTSRGVLHAKTDGSKFNDFVLPTIDLTQIITHDIKLNISDFSNDV